MSHIVYSRGPAPPHLLKRGAKQRNPRFFVAPEAGVVGVTVIGDFPNIVEAYKAEKIAVEVVDGPPAPRKGPIEISSAGPAEQAAAEAAAE